MSECAIERMSEGESNLSAELQPLIHSIAHSLIKKNGAKVRNFGGENACCCKFCSWELPQRPSIFMFFHQFNAPKNQAEATEKKKTRRDETAVPAPEIQLSVFFNELG